MKKTKNRVKEIIIAVVAITLFVTASFRFSSDVGSTEPLYSVLNTRETGVSVLYETLKKMGFPVEIDYQKITKLTPLSDIQVVVTPDSAYCSDKELEEMLNWVFDGGLLIFAYGKSSGYFDAMLEKRRVKPYETAAFSYYQLGFGEIYTLDANLITNKTLAADTSGGLVFVDILGEYYYYSLNFNEFYHGLGQAGSFTADLPAGVKILVVQVVMVAFLIVFYYGRRFGKPVPYYEETDRDENEFVLTVANVYERAKIDKGVGGH